MFDSRGYKKRTQCAICGNTDTHIILDYNLAPLAGEFLKKEQLGSETLYPLRFEFCPLCGLFQTDSIIDPDILFKDYRYVSSVGLTKHFEQVAEYLVESFCLNENSKVLDIGCNDGVLLRPLMQRSIPSIGIDPAVNITQMARDSGCDVITDYFNLPNAQKYFQSESMDVVTCMNCFAHIDDIHEIVEGVKYVLKPNGKFVIEVHYIKNLIEQMAYDNLYAEHIYEYSLNSLSYLFEKHGMFIADFEEIPVHAGSIRVVAAKQNSDVKIELYKIAEQLVKEDVALLTHLDGFKLFAEKVDQHAFALHDLIADLSSQGNKIIGYGASGRANMLSHLVDLSPDLIQYIVDESPERYGRYLSSTHIPIYNKEFLDNDPEQPDYVLIFAWNFAKMIIEKLQGKNYKFILPFPTPTIINDISELDMYTL
jgi:methylation protein EvaC